MSKILALTRFNEQNKKIEQKQDEEEKKDDDDDDDDEAKDDNKEEIDPQMERRKKDAKHVINQLSNAVQDLSNDVNIDECLLALYLLSCQEQYLYYKYKKDNEGKAISKVPLKTVKSVINRFNESFEKTKYEQILAIAEAKLIIFYFVR